MMEPTDDHRLARELVDRFGGNVWGPEWADAVQLFVERNKLGPQPTAGAVYEYAGGPVEAICPVSKRPDLWVVEWVRDGLGMASLPFVIPVVLLGSVIESDDEESDDDEGGE